MQSTVAVVESSPKSRKRLRKIRFVFFAFHFTCFLLGSGMIILGVSAKFLEEKVIEVVNLDTTKTIRFLYYINGSLVILNTILGVLALVKHKPYLWMIYCTVLALLSLLILSTAGTVFSLEVSLVKARMLDLLRDYRDDTKERIYPHSTVEVIDRLQERLKCCGMDSFKDWQDVEYGRTSLKVPRSCCRLKKPKTELQPVTSDPNRLSELEKYEDCGLLCLPSHRNVDNFLHTEGCLPKIFGPLQTLVTVMAWLSLITGAIFGTAFFITCHLIFSNGI